MVLLPLKLEFSYSLGEFEISSTSRGTLKVPFEISIAMIDLLLEIYVNSWNTTRNEFPGAFFAYKVYASSTLIRLNYTSYLAF